MQLPGAFNSMVSPAPSLDAEIGPLSDNGFTHSGMASESVYRPKMTNSISVQNLIINSFRFSFIQKCADRQAPLLLVSESVWCIRPNAANHVATKISKGCLYRKNKHSCRNYPQFRWQNLEGNVVLPVALAKPSNGGRNAISLSTFTHGTYLPLDLTAKDMLFGDGFWWFPWE